MKKKYEPKEFNVDLTNFIGQIWKGSINQMLRFRLGGRGRANFKAPKISDHA
jgi:hypothetical protein